MFSCHFQENINLDIVIQSANIPKVLLLFLSQGYGE